MIKTVNLTDAAIIETHTIWNSTTRINKRIFENMSTECHIIEKHLQWSMKALIDYIIMSQWNQPMIGGSSTLEMIDDAICTYKTGVAKIDKKLSNLNYE